MRAEPKEEVTTDPHSSIQIAIEFAKDSANYFALLDY